MMNGMTMKILMNFMKTLRIEDAMELDYDDYEFEEERG
jgi:hypothetical protein